MQTLWTRVAQVRGSCRCPQCLSAANGVSRRATATATRRMPKYLTSSTLWYSGIFAAAATFDAGIKKRRREQWDRAIAGVKQDLEESVDVRREEGLELLEAALVNIDNGEVRHEWGPVLPAEEDAFQYTTVEQQPAQDAGAQSQPFAQESSRDTEDQFKPFTTSYDDGNMFQYVEQRSKRPRWPSNTGAHLRESQLPPESIYAHPGRKRKQENTPFSPKKLAEIQISVEMLLLYMLRELQKHKSSLEASKAVPEEFAKHVLMDESELKSCLDSKYQTRLRIAASDGRLSDYQPWEQDTVSFCKFNQDHIGDSNRAVQKLNTSLLQLFKLQAQNEISRSTLLAKLAYNLSMCSGPPNLKTFNTMLLGFSATDEYPLVNRVIKSTDGSHMRPNEVTLAAILKYYTKTDRPDMFVRWVERMRGKHGGLCLARPGITTTGCGSHRLLQSTEDPDKIFQLPYATPFVFGPLIAGVIKFAGFESALAICQDMGLEGWGLCMSGLTPLLHDCADRAEWSSGLAIWKQIQALKAVSRRKEGTNWLSERIKLETYAAMLRLCTRCDKRDYFDSIWDKAVKAHATSTDKLVRLVKGEVDTELEADPTPDAREIAEVRGQLNEINQYGSRVEDSVIGAISGLGISDEKELPSEKHVQATRDSRDEARRLPAVESKVAEEIPQRDAFGTRRNISQESLPANINAAKKLRHRSALHERPKVLNEQLLGLIASDGGISPSALHDLRMRFSARD